MSKILWKRGEIAPGEQFLLLSIIFSYLMLNFSVNTRIRFSLRDKRLFEITEVEITRVDCIKMKMFADKTKRLVTGRADLDSIFGPNMEMLIRLCENACWSDYSLRAHAVSHILLPATLRAHACKPCALVREDHLDRKTTTMLKQSSMQDQISNDFKCSNLT